MKRILIYALIMILTVAVLPLLIVKGCSSAKEETIPEQEPIEDKVKVTVYIKSENKMREMDLEEYLKGVVAAEMPAEFEVEALKAQAVAARTYTYARMIKATAPANHVHEGADVCTDPACCQAWTEKQAAMKKWGIFSAAKYWSKIEKAVAETADTIITYQKGITNPVFHSNSGGRTENAEEVWSGGAEPYLKSVVSEGEDAYSEFQSTVSIKIKDFCEKLKQEYPDIKLSQKNIMDEIKVLSHTTGGRVKEIKIGNLTLKGTQVRSLFSLRSANFTIEKADEATLKIMTLGNGHGVGMSQWGANYLAKNGAAYDEIIKYYYQGVELDTIENFQLALNSSESK